MPRERRGGNTAYRVKRQQLHGFDATRDELEDTDKDELLETAVSLGVLSDVPRNGETDVPLKSDLVEYLATLTPQRLSG